MKAIVVGLTGMRIEHRTGEILQGLDCLGDELAKFGGDFIIISISLNPAQSDHRSADPRLERCGENFSPRSQREPAPAGRQPVSEPPCI